MKGPRKHPLESFSPVFKSSSHTSESKWRLSPFFTNLDQSVYTPLIFSPEVIGALCSRASRAADDLRDVFLKEYIDSFLEITRGENESEEDLQAKKNYGQELAEFISFLHRHPIEKIFSNPRARSFYAKWLAQYGDDSIAQMAGSHLVFAGISQVAIKHFEDQRIGLAPIEKSTRYVNYSNKVKGQYLYYTDPTLKDIGLEKEYRAAMDGLFDTYAQLLPRLTTWLSGRFPEEKKTVVEKKSFDSLRGLLPTSTLSQVAFFGNGQAFEYLVSRSLGHPLGEVRWAGERAYQELYKVTPSFLRRIKDPESQNLVTTYQNYLAGKNTRMMPFVEKYLADQQPTGPNLTQPTVALVEYDPQAEIKVVTGMLYAAANNHASWQETSDTVRTMSPAERQKIIDHYLANRSQRWQKVGRAFENSYLRFEITMNIGAWRDLHRHRMLTQQRQYFSCQHGFDVPPEAVEAGLEKEFTAAITPVEAVHEKISKHSPDLAQYAVTLAHRLRFMQWQNMRECFWEMELRTIPEGHPDYRHIEQEKFKLFEKAYPSIAKHMRVNLGHYDFARRGQEEKIQTKLKQLTHLPVS